MAGALTGRRDWSVVPTERIDGWRLADCQAHWEVEVESQREDEIRPSFECLIVHHGNHLPAAFFNRAQAAVYEAAILVSRLDMISSEKLLEELTYLNIAISKTAGPRERQAWRWLIEAAAGHPNHDIATESLL